MIKFLIRFGSIIICIAILGAAVLFTMKGDISEMKKDWDNLMAAPWLPEYVDTQAPEESGVSEGDEILDIED